MTRYSISLYRADLNYLERTQDFSFEDYDSLQNLIGYMTEGSDDILIRIRKEEAYDEQ